MIKDRLACVVLDAIIEDAAKGGGRLVLPPTGEIVDALATVQALMLAASPMMSMPGMLRPTVNDLAAEVHRQSLAFRAKVAGAETPLDAVLSQVEGVR